MVVDGQWNKSELVVVGEIVFPRYKLVVVMNNVVFCSNEELEVVVDDVGALSN